MRNIQERVIPVCEKFINGENLTELPSDSKSYFMESLQIGSSLAHQNLEVAQFIKIQKMIMMQPSIVVHDNEIFYFPYKIALNHLLDLLKTA